MRLVRGRNKNHTAYSYTVVHSPSTDRNLKVTNSYQARYAHIKVLYGHAFLSQSLSTTDASSMRSPACPRRAAVGAGAAPAALSATFIVPAMWAMPPPSSRGSTWSQASNLAVSTESDPRKQPHPGRPAGTLPESPTRQHAPRASFQHTTRLVGGLPPVVCIDSCHVRRLRLVWVSR